MGCEGQTLQGLVRAAIHHIGNGGNAFVNVPSHSNRKRPTVKCGRAVYRQANIVRRTSSGEHRQANFGRRISATHHPQARHQRWLATAPFAASWLFYVICNRFDCQQVQIPTLLLSNSYFVFDGFKISDADAFDVHYFFDGFESAIPLAVFDDALGALFANAGQRH